MIMSFSIETINMNRMLVFCLRWTYTTVYKTCKKCLLIFHSQLFAKRFVTKFVFIEEPIYLFMAADKQKQHNGKLI